MTDVPPQHDLDERKRLGREIGLENARRGQPIKRFKAYEIFRGAPSIVPRLNELVDAINALNGR